MSAYFLGRFTYVTRQHNICRDVATPQRWLNQRFKINVIYYFYLYMCVFALQVLAAYDCACAPAFPPGYRAIRVWLDFSFWSWK